jgi:glutamyl-tRNA reductase
MNLLLLGMSHHSAPIDLREQLAIPDQLLSEAVRSLMREPGVNEGLIVSTCNRVEVLADASGEPDLRGFLARLHGRDLNGLRGVFYEHREREALRHIFRVACSLDSMLVGEPQILGQVKNAYRVAREAGAVRGTLEAVMSRAFAVAKRVRTDTQIGRNPTSISHAAVDLAEQIFGTLRGKCVLLIGAGKMGQLAARCLVDQGAGRLLIANRTLERAQMLAEEFNAEPLPLGEVANRGYQADIIISCTGGGQPVLRRDDVAGFLARRRHRPVLVLDIAVPRDVEPAVHKLENAFVYNVDDLQAVVDSNLADRQREAMRAEAIVDAEVDSFVRHLGTLDIVPTLRALQDHAERLRSHELQRNRNRLGPLTPEQERAVDGLTRSLMQKWLHRPIVELKEMARDSSAVSAVELVHRLFGLSSSDNSTDTYTKSGKDDPVE